MSEWTIDTLREHQDLKISALEEKTDLQFKLNQVALDKAELKMNVRLESLNEWRGQLKDERSSFATKEEVKLLSRMVYIGVGIMLAFELIFKYFAK